MNNQPRKTIEQRAADLALARLSDPAHSMDRAAATRLRNAKDLVASGGVLPVAWNDYQVRAADGGAYDVHLSEVGSGLCTCCAFTKTGAPTCKHIVAVKLYMEGSASLVKEIREEQAKIAREAAELGI